MRDRLPRWAAAVACAVLAVWVVLGSVPSASAADEVAFTWSDPRLATPAGLARDTDHGVYWVANSGRYATTAVYAVRPDGRTAARLVLNIPTTAVEAVGYQTGRVFLADIGDPNRTRTQIAVSFATVPSLADATVTYRSWDFTYPDGAHDAEALLLGPGTQIYVVTKGASPGIYKAPAQPVATKANALTRVADAPAGVTDGTFLPSGRVALRTATEVLELDPATWETVATSTLPTQQNGKTLAPTLDGAALLAGGQGIGTPVHKVALPSAVATATPTPTPTPGAQSSDSQPVIEEGDRSGTLVALVAAALVAVAAGAYTLVRR